MPVVVTKISIGYEPLITKAIRQEVIKEDIGKAWAAMYTSWIRYRFEVFSKTGGVGFKNEKEPIKYSKKDGLGYGLAVEGSMGLVAGSKALIEGGVAFAGATGGIGAAIGLGGAVAGGIGVVLGYAGETATIAAAGAHDAITFAKNAIKHPTHPFSAGISAEGDTWPPLAPSTLERRRKEGKGAAILRDTGLLFASLRFTAKIYAGNGMIDTAMILDAPQRYPRGAATVGDLVSFHNTGGKHLPRRLISARPRNVDVQDLTVGKRLAAGIMGALDINGLTERWLNETREISGHGLVNAMAAVAKFIFMQYFLVYARRGVNVTQISYAARIPTSVHGEILAKGLAMPVASGSGGRNA